MSIGLRYVFDHVARWPARLQGVLVKRRPIFRLGGQVSHGLSSRWLEWGHDLVMGGGTAAPCVCVCLCWNLWTTAVRRHQRAELRCFSPPFKVSCHTAEPSRCGILRIDLLIHERDGLLLRAPGDNTGGAPYTPRRKTLSCLCSIYTALSHTPDFP